MEEPKNSEWTYSLFNDRFVNPFNTGSRTFPQFALLPAEIRLEIWAASLPPMRMVGIELMYGWPGCGGSDDGPWGLCDPFDDSVRNHLGNIVTGFPYEIFLKHPHATLWNKGYNALERVNSEARSVYLQRYRMALPLRSPLVPGKEGKGILRLDPETDLIKMSLKRDYLPDMIETPYKDMLCAFLHDTYVSDPKGTGLVHLAVDGEVWVDGLAHAWREWFPIHPGWDSRVLERRGRPAAAERLRDYLVRFGDESSPHTFYVSHCIDEGELGIYRHGRNEDGEVQLRRSVPIIPRGEQTLDGWAISSVTAHFGKDPRPITTGDTHSCLEVHVDVEQDPRLHIRHWRDLIVRLGVKDSQRVLSKVRHIVTVWPKGRRADSIHTRRGLVENILHPADRQWLEHLVHGTRTLFITVTRSRKQQTRDGQAARRDGQAFEKLLKRSPHHENGVQEVAGAWIFGAQVFGDIDDESYELEGQGGMPMVDLERHHPGLLVFDLF